MKKIIGGLILLIVIAAAGWGVYVFFIQHTEIEDVLPAEPVVYLQGTDLKESVMKLRGDPLWSIVMSIDYVALMSKAPQSEQQKKILQRFQQIMTDPDVLAAMDAFFGNDVALAIYPPDINLGALTGGGNIANVMNNLLLDVLSSFVVVTRVGPGAQIAEFGSKFFILPDGEVTTEKISYKGHTIYKLSPPDQSIPLGLVRFGDVMHIGITEKPAMKAIDVKLGERPSLAKQPTFQKFRSGMLDESDFQIYLGVETFLNYLNAQWNSVLPLVQMGAGAQMEQVNNGIEQFRRSLSGFLAFGGSLAMLDMTKIKTDWLFDVNRMAMETAGFYRDCRNTKNTTLGFVPVNVLGYQWSSCLNLKQYWNQYLSEMKNTPGGQNAQSLQVQLSALEGMLGMKVDEFIAAFGQDVGGYLTDIQMDGSPFPVPSLAMFIEIRDRAKMEQILKRFQNSPLLVSQTESYGGTDIVFFNTMFSQDLQPAYAFIGDFLLLAVNKGMIQTAIDGNAGKVPTLKSNEQMQAMGLSPQKPKIGSFYLKMAPLSEKLNGLIDWGVGMVQKQEQQKEAFQSGAKGRLEDVIKKIEEAERELSGIETEIGYLKQSIEEFAGSGLNVTAKEQELRGLEEKQSELQTQLADAQAQETELQGIMESYQGLKQAKQQRETVLNDVVFPLMRALSRIKTISSETTMSQDKLEVLTVIED